MSKGRPVGLTPASLVASGWVAPSKFSITTHRLVGAHFRLEGTGFLFKHRETHSFPLALPRPPLPPIANLMDDLYEYTFIRT